MKIFFNDPFDLSSIERLKFLFLYCEEVEAMDYSSLFTDASRDGWTGFMSSRNWEQELDREIRKAVGARKIDRNELARLKMRHRPQINQMRKEAAARFERIFLNHERYWRYLRNLAQLGVVKLLDADEYFDRRSPVRLKEEEARNFARTTTNDLKDWLYEYLRTNSPDAFAGPSEEMQAVMGLNAMVLSAYMMGALMKHADGASLYTGAAAQLRAVRALFNCPTPASTRLGEEVISVELPVLRSRDIWDLIRAKEKLAGHRRAFVLEMNSLAAGLEQHDWDETLISEIKLQKKQKVDPILYDLTREVASLNQQVIASSSPYATGAGIMGLTFAILVQRGASFDPAMIASLVAALGIGTADWFRERYQKRSQIDRNRLAYVINLREELAK